MDATFWATVALVIFLAVAFYLKVPGQMAAGLDKRADKIKDELNEARRLREDAQELLAEYQLRRKEAEQEASDILSAAKREAVNLAKDAEEKTAEFVARRTAQAEVKISQAEAQAIAEVRASAADIAIAAASKIIAGTATGSTADKMIADSIKEVKARLN